MFSDDLTLLDICLGKIERCLVPNSQCFLAVHEKQLKRIWAKYKINLFERSRESAHAESGLKHIYEWWDKLPYEYVVLVNPCLPFLSKQTINEFVKFCLSNKYNGVFSVVRHKNYFWDTKGNLLNEWPKGIDLMDTKRVTSTFSGAHALYYSKMSDIGEGIWLGPTPFQKDSPALFEIPKRESIDIDNEEDWKMAQILWKNGW